MPCDGANLMELPLVVRPSERATFDIYFASICSMQFHPGAGTREHVVLSAQQCADAALEMLRIRRSLIED